MPCAPFLERIFHPSAHKARLAAERTAREAREAAEREKRRQARKAEQARIESNPAAQGLPKYDSPIWEKRHSIHAPQRERDPTATSPIPAIIEPGAVVPVPVPPVTSAAASVISGIDGGGVGAPRRPKTGTVTLSVRASGNRKGQQARGNGSIASTGTRKSSIAWADGGEAWSGNWARERRASNADSTKGLAPDENEEDGVTVPAEEANGTVKDAAEEEGNGAPVVEEMRGRRSSSKAGIRTSGISSTGITTIPGLAVGVPRTG